MFTGSGYADISELDRYKLVSNIGKGSFGVISKVQRVDDGKVSLKAYDATSGISFNILPAMDRVLPRLDPY